MIVEKLCILRIYFWDKYVIMIIKNGGAEHEDKRGNSF